MGDLGFVALNAMTPIQTVTPELSMLLTTPTNRMAHLYSPILVMGGKQEHVVQTLNPWKIMRAAFNEMRAPSQELREAFTLAQKNHIIGPRFLETFMT